MAARNLSQQTANHQFADVQNFDSAIREWHICRGSLFRKLTVKAEFVGNYDSPQIFRKMRKARYEQLMAELHGTHIARVWDMIFPAVRTPACGCPRTGETNPKLF